MWEPIRGKYESAASGPSRQRLHPASSEALPYLELFIIERPGGSQEDARSRCIQPRQAGLGEYLISSCLLPVGSLPSSSLNSSTGLSILAIGQVNSLHSR